MPRTFFKMQGCGNDYLFFDCRKAGISSPNELSIRLSDRRFGVGGDGIVLLLPSKIADVKMRIFNADGTEGNICGTALRCIGKILFDEGQINCSVETNVGVKQVCHVSGNTFSVDLGKAEFSAQSIPALFSSKVVDMPFMGYNVTCVSMGNPHIVLFDEPVGFPLGEVAEKIRKSGYFPQGVNVEVCKVVDGEIVARVNERGSGETLSCGSGACAIANASYITHRTGKEVCIHFLGGMVQVKLTESGTLLIGEAVKVFTGDIDL